MSLRTTRLAVIGWAAVLFAMAPLRVHAQQNKAFIDCSDTNSFSFIASTGILLEDLSEPNTDFQRVTLPFGFPFFADGKTYDTVDVFNLAFIRLAEVGVTDTFGFIEVAYDGLDFQSNVEVTDVFFQQNGSDSPVIFSFENFNIGDTEVASNAQVTLFSNGDFTLCYGSGDTNDGFILARAFVQTIGQSPVGIGVNLPPFSSIGQANTWPTGKCFCYTLPPTEAPTDEPSDSPSMAPSSSNAPSSQPSSNPSTSLAPSNQPTFCLKKSKTKSPGKKSKASGKRSGGMTKSPVQTCF